MHSNQTSVCHRIKDLIYELTLDDINNPFVQCQGQLYNVISRTLSIYIIVATTCDEIFSENILSTDKNTTYYCYRPGFWDNWLSEAHAPKIVGVQR